MWGVVNGSFTICIKKDNVCETRGRGGPTGLFCVYAVSYTVILWLICIAPTRSIKVRSYINTRTENPSQNQDNTMMSSISIMDGIHTKGLYLLRNKKSHFI